MLDAYDQSLDLRLSYRSLQIAAPPTGFAASTALLYLAICLFWAGIIYVALAAI